MIYPPQIICWQRFNRMRTLVAKFGAGGDGRSGHSIIIIRFLGEKSLACLAGKIPLSTATTPKGTALILQHVDRMRNGAVFITVNHLQTTSTCRTYRETAILVYFQVRLLALPIAVNCIQASTAFQSGFLSTV